MNNREIQLARRYLSVAIAQRCLSPIPRSGKAGAQVDCFSVFLNRPDGSPFLLVTGLTEGSLEGREWDGTAHQLPRTIPLADVQAADLAVTHFYGLSNVQYSGLKNLSIGLRFRLPYVRLLAERVIFTVRQTVFNRKKLVAKQRIDILRAAVDMHLEGQEEINAVSLLTRVHTVWWIGHPMKDYERRRFAMYLESFAASGEMTESDRGFKVNGSALSAIAEYEEQERKHIESTRVQWGVFWLTLAIVFLTAVQAGVMKLPTLLGWSGSN